MVGTTETVVVRWYWADACGHTVEHLIPATLTRHDQVQAVNGREYPSLANVWEGPEWDAWDAAEATIEQADTEQGGG